MNFSTHRFSNYLDALQYSARMPCCLALVLLANSASADYAFEVIADDSTLIPGTSSTFVNFGSPDISGNTIVFSGGPSFAGAQDGVYTSENGVLEVVADITTTIPGDSIVYGGFGNPFIDGNTIVFGAISNNGGEFGAEIDGILNTPIPRGAPLPNTANTFQGISNDPAVNGTKIGFLTEAGYFLENGGITAFADDTTPIPGGIGNFMFIGALDIDGERVVFFAEGTAGQRGLYLYENGALSRLADLNTPAPDSRGSFTSFGRPRISGSNIVFLADTTNGGRGVFLYNSGSISVIADTMTIAPDRSNNFSDVGGVDVSEDKVIFIGIDTQGNFDLIQYETNTLTRIIGSGDTLDGRQIEQTALVPAIDGNNIVFGIFYTDFTLALVSGSSNQDNMAPTALAGNNQSIHAGQEVQLDGSASFDDNTASIDLLYSWSLVQQPVASTTVLQNANTPTPTFIADLPGTYLVELIVEDEAGNMSDPSQTEVSSLNVSPQAEAGDDLMALLLSEVILDGSGSSDADNDTLTFQWTITSAPAGSTSTLNDPTLVNPSLQPDVTGTYEITLVVDDGFGPSIPDTVTLTASQAGDFAQLQLVEAATVVSTLPASSFDTPGHRNNLTNRIASASRAIQTGRMQQAESRLDRAIDRTDGCELRGEPDPRAPGGDGPKRDWIVNCTDQEMLYAPLDSAMEAISQ